MTGMVEVRLETPEDRAAVWSVVASAFATHAEADLVDRLRADDDVVYSLVACEGDDVVGHVLFSRMTAPFRALGLAPVATSASHQRQGIAARLIEDGLARARRDGWEGVFVLGAPAYYGRFGFDAALAAGFSSPYAGEHFMALTLGGTLPTLAGAVAYAPAFAALG
jgi:putative acetyltransferase